MVRPNELNSEMPFALQDSYVIFHFVAFETATEKPEVNNSDNI